MTVYSPQINIDPAASDDIDGLSAKAKVNKSTTVNLKKHVSCRVTNSILKYLELKGYDVDSVISGLPYSKEYLCDSLNWTDYETKEIMTSRAAVLTNNAAIMYDVGLLTPKLNSLGGIESMVRLLAGPKTVYKLVPKYVTLFDKLFKLKATFNGDNQAMVTMSVSSDHPPLKASCYYAQGILAAIQTLWNLPPAEIYEKKCMCQPEPGNIKEDVQYGAEVCEWEIRWQPPKPWRGKLRDSLNFKRHRFSSKIDDLERNFRLLDQKNAELIAKNKQLAAVREITIGVDKVSTLDEALSLAVERARDINGIRFVFVQKVDVTGQFIITPYYSKIRNTYAARAIKALGFDAEKELGASPASKNLLRFPSMKLKIAQDYLRNPRVMVMPTLAELLDGVWPRTLCDGIQKILGVKKIAIIPLMVEGKSWGNMLYFLDQDIPIDILEMIAAHCALAIKNIITLNSLELRNNESEVARVELEKSIEKRKAAERNLKRQKDLTDRVLATIPNAVLLLNKNLQIIMANKFFYDLFTLKKNNVENKYIRQLIDTPELNDAMAQTLNCKEKKASTEFRCSVASSDKILLTNIFAMAEGDLLLVINDVTEERQRQERLLLTDRLASVGEMASGVAHELNNPLTGIIGLSSLLTEQNMPDDVKEDLAAIHSEAQRCATIVKNLLTFARKHEPKRAPVQVAKILEDVLRLRAYEHRARNISIENQLPPDLPDVLADYFQIQQVFLNIILNAEMAMIDANGRGTLKITGEKVDGYTRVSFTDNGPGISKENLRLIFNPFFTTKEVGKGTGLGLSICYGIVTSHGGKIYARSEFGHGATFVVELPARVNNGPES